MGQGVSEIFWLRSHLPNVSTSCGSTCCMGVGLTYGSKQLIEIDRNSTPVQPMHELAYFKNIGLTFCTMVRLLAYKSYRSLLLILCYVKHSVASKLFSQLHPRHQLNIGDDYKLNCSKLISMHYCLGSILSYKTLQNFGIVLFQGYVCVLSNKRYWSIYTPRYLVQVVCFISESLIFTSKLQD